MAEERKEYSYARVEIKGRLGRDIDLRYTPTGKAMAQTTVAVGRVAKGQKETDWYRVTVWDQKAEEIAAAGYSKGDIVTVKGNLSQYEYQKDGATQRLMQVSVTEISKEA